MSSPTIDQFKHQTFTLLKQQSTKLKTLTHELELKQQQISLLKQTISVLQSQNQQNERAKHSLKNKIDIIMREVSNYNDCVVVRLREEGEGLRGRVGELEGLYGEAVESVKRLSKELEVCEGRLQKATAELVQLRNTASTTANQLLKHQSEHTTLKSHLAHHQHQQTKLQSLNEQLQSKLHSQQKQIDSLVQKCQQTVTAYEKKIRAFRDTHVRKQQMARLETELERSGKKVEELKREVERVGREKGEIGVVMRGVREREMAGEMKGQIQTALLESDLRNLKDSCKLTKKVNQFQSKYSDIFQSILQSFQHHIQSTQQLQKTKQLLQERVLQFQRLLTEKQTLLDQCRNELQIVSSKFRTQVEGVEAMYEGKILQLSIKIKKEERALREMGVRDREFEALNGEYERLGGEYVQVKETLENTIQRYKKQNQKLAGQIQQLIQLCDENIITKNSLNCLKHSLNNLLAVIYFLYLNITRNRQAKRKIYLPFVEFYFRTKHAFENRNNSVGGTLSKRKGTGLRKFRACVVMVMAIKRMQRGCGSGYVGLLRYVDRAVKFKGKIEDLSEYLQSMLQKAIKNEKNVIEFLRENKNVYKWNCLNNYLKVNIPSNWFQGVLEK